MITAYGSVEAAVEALKPGANDYFSKPWDNEKLMIEIDRMIARRRLEYENTAPQARAQAALQLPQHHRQERAHAAPARPGGAGGPSRSTILITGETGTGKELVAKAIHANSPRADQMFVAVNSGSLPPELLESTLFGHVKGAFTSAIHTKKGYFEVADRGTIFFDEIGTIGAGNADQTAARDPGEGVHAARLHRSRSKVDVRILAATNADLRKLVEEGKFREDLYYRLNVINIALPPLRDRKEDIPLLVEHFFTKYCEENDKFLDAAGKSLLRFQPEAMQVLMEHNWPGNVRELENVVERAVVLATEASVPVDVLPDTLLQASGVRFNRDEGGPLAADASLFEIVNDFERQHHHGASGGVQLEPDGGRREPARSALHAQPEDQEVGHRRPKIQERLC